MLNRTELKRIANAVYKGMYEMHRGAYAIDRTGSVIVFGNDAYEGNERTRAVVAVSRRMLTHDGFTVGEVATSTREAAGYTWVFEAVPTTGAAVGTAVRMCQSAVWDAWSAVCNNGEEHDAYCVVQKRIAGVTETINPNV